MRGAWIAWTMAGLLPLQAVAPLAAYADDPREAALALSKQALEAYLAGDFAGAEALYTQAYRTWSGEPLYLYNAARAAERAGHREAAERMYQEYLSKAPPGQPEVAKARFHLGELRASKPTAPAVPPPKNPGPAAGSAGKGAGGLALLITGGVVAVGGGLLLGSAASDQSELDSRLGQRDAKGNIIGISHTDAVAKQSGINTKEYIGWGMVGAGAVAGILGAVLMANSPSSRVVLLPQERGMALALRF